MSALKYLLISSEEKQVQNMSTSKSECDEKEPCTKGSRNRRVSVKNNDGLILTQRHCFLKESNVFNFGYRITIFSISDCTLGEVTILKVFPQPDGEILNFTSKSTITTC